MVSHGKYQAISVILKAKGLGSSCSWAAEPQVQHEREAVSSPLLTLCSRTSAHKELPFFSIFLENQENRPT